MDHYITNTIYLLLAGVLASYLGGIIFRAKERQVSGVIALGSLIAGLINFSAAFGSSASTVSWLVVETGLVLTVIVNLYSLSYMEEDTGTGKFFPLLILLIISVIGLAFSEDLFNIYLFFELLAITSFTLVAYRKERWEPVEAGIKFLVMSATGSALILLGIALIYKDFGTLNIRSIAQIGYLPLACFIIGFGIKAAMFPLHTWLPDAHAEAPSGISAMLSGIVIEAGFFVLFRILISSGARLHWGNLLVWFALLTMTAGNLMALSQKRMKRMLAYSSVSQMGYILLGAGIGTVYGIQSGITGSIFHIVTHAFMKGLAFLCAGALIFRIGSGEIDDMRGAARRMPLTGIAFIIAVLSLAGVPPFSGFMSKLLIYQSGIQSGTTLGWTASIVAIFNSVFSLGYYLPAAAVLYSKDISPKAAKIKEAPVLMIMALIILAVITIYLGIMPEPVRSWASAVIGQSGTQGFSPILSAAANTPCLGRVQ